MQHLWYNPTAVGSCDIAPKTRILLNESCLAVSGLEDASNQAIVAKNRLTGISLVAARLFVTLRRFYPAMRTDRSWSADQMHPHSRRDPWGCPMSRFSDIG